MKSKISLILCGGLLLLPFCDSFSEVSTTENSKGMSTKQTYDLDPVFFMLGSTDEYMGRAIFNNSDCLESFYSNEVAAAKLYALYLEKALSNRSITNGYSVTVLDNGNIFFYSQEMTEIINSYYDENPVIGTGQLKSRIYDKNDNLILAYLAGAYSRHGESNAFHFTNSGAKVDRILKEIQPPNCEMVILTYKRGLPASSTITFQPGILDSLFTYVMEQKKIANNRAIE